MIAVMLVTFFLVQELRHTIASSAGPALDVAVAIDSLIRKVVGLQTTVLFIIVLGACHLIATDRRRTKAISAQISNQTKKLLESKEKCQTLFDNTDALVFVLNTEGQYVTMNQYGLNYLNTSIKEIQHKYVEEHLGEKSAPRFRDDFRQALECGELTKSMEYLVIKGKECYVDLYMKVLKTGENEDPSILVIIRDVTQKKLFEEKLLQAEKLVSLGVLSGGVAHEINNPLGIIMGFCELLLEKTPKASEQHRVLSIIYKQSQQCKKIIEGLLNFTRLSGVENGHSNVLVPLHTVIGMLRGFLSKKGIELVLDLPETLPQTKANATAMQQVFLNVISNAMDAMPSGGTLRISAALRTKAPRQGDAHGTLPGTRQYIEINIADNGVGIPAENMNKIFDPFFTTKPVGKGTGLGLSVTYGLVTEYNGTITCQSPIMNGDQGESRGTCMTIRLPVAEE